MLCDLYASFCLPDAYRQSCKKRAGEKKEALFLIILYVEVNKTS